MNQYVGPFIVGWEIDTQVFVIFYNIQDSVVVSQLYVIIMKDVRNEYIFHFCRI